MLQHRRNPVEFYHPSTTFSLLMDCYGHVCLLGIYCLCKVPCNALVL